MHLLIQVPLITQQNYFVRPCQLSRVIIISGSNIREVNEGKGIWSY
jgi:hypothetical protein